MGLKEKFEKLIYGALMILFALPLVSWMYSTIANVPITDAILLMVVNLLPVIFIIGVVYALWKWDNSSDVPKLPS